MTPTHTSLRHGYPGDRVGLTRRAVLRGGAAAVSVGVLAFPVAAQAYATQVTLLVDGVGPGLDPAMLEAVIAPFLSAGLPVTCVADLLALTGAGADQPLCDCLAMLALRDPGLFDLALPIGKLPRPERYFQLRRAGELRQAVLAAFAAGPAAHKSFPVVTLVDRGEDPNIDHTAFRGAGFRAHLRAGTGPLLQTVAGRGELVMQGGLWTRMDAPDLEQRLFAALNRGEDLLVSLSLTGIGEKGLSALPAHAARIASHLGQAFSAGRIHMASPAQLRLFAGEGLPLDVALLIEPGMEPEEDAAVLAFLGELASQGVPLTVTGRADHFGPLPGTVHFCAPSAKDGAAPLPLPACLRDNGGSVGSSGQSVAVHVGPASVWPRQGIDPDGLLQLALRQLPDGPEAVLDLSPLEDHLVTIRPTDVLQPVRRAQLIRRFVEAALAGRAYFHTIPGLARHLVETEPVLARLWSVRRRAVTDPFRPPAPDTDERARLIGDARLAWRYVDRFTDAKTGLCAGTVQTGQTTVINREATMWDLASQLHGIRVAHQLAFIDKSEASDRVLLLLQNLPLGDVEGLHLPPAMFRTDDGSIVAPGFDVCDVGRFLVALRSVVTAGLVDSITAEMVPAVWDLSQALPEGRPHSHLKDSWTDTTLSHCTPYIRRGFDLWGYSLLSPYAGLEGGTKTDRQIAQLYDVARIGQVGVEPALLDLIELGPDPSAGLIADVLFDAQLDWFETTGQLKCASEAPLNFSPWFSYQGLRFGALGEAAWVVRGLGGAAEHDTPEFRAKAELLSTKSAYLWSALRSHAWCSQLLQVIREKTRIEGLGFSVGVFTGTMRAMPNYTDLNTNGVILTAIGHALR